MKLYIIRHGETADNAKRICQGHGGGPLSEKGEQQAEALGEWFSKIHLDALYSSDLQRAVQTASCILSKQEGLRLQKDQRIRERYFHEMQGKVFPKEFDWFNMPDGVETTDEMHARGKHFIEEIYGLHKDQTVAVVSHGGMILAMLLLLYNLPAEDYLKYKGVYNTGIFCFDIHSDFKVEMLMHNELPHLEKNRDEEKQTENC